MSKGKNQKSEIPADPPAVQLYRKNGANWEAVPPSCAIIENAADIDLVIETLNSLQALRRYGKEEEAIEEAKAAMLRIKERA